MDTMQHKALHTCVYQSTGEMQFFNSEVRPTSSYFYREGLVHLTQKVKHHAKTSTRFCLHYVLLHELLKNVRKPYCSQCDCFKSHFSRVENVSEPLPGCK